MQDIIQFLGLPFLECLLMIGILGYLGIHVLEREVIFIDIALAQISAVGSIIAFIIFKTEHHSLLSYICALSFTLIAAAFYSLVRRKITQISLEAVIGVSYAIAAATAFFLLATSAEGHTHIQHMLTGSILWAKWSDILLGGIIFSVTGVFFYLFRKIFKKISNDYKSGVVEGVSLVWWDFLFYALLGVVITFSVRIAGILVVFSFLIIPATISAMFSSRFGVRLLIAWLVGAIVSILGLMFSYRFDFSVGPSVVTFLGLALIIVSVVKRAFSRIDMDGIRKNIIPML
ncbi:hypothetical protein ES703_103607 [subsurface metagenome]